MGNIELFFFVPIVKTCSVCSLVFLSDQWWGWVHPAPVRLPATWAFRWAAQKLELISSDISQVVDVFLCVVLREDVLSMVFSVLSKQKTNLKGNVAINVLYFLASCSDFVHAAYIGALVPQKIWEVLWFVLFLFVKRKSVTCKGKKAVGVSSLAAFVENDCLEIYFSGCRLAVHARGHAAPIIGEVADLVLLWNVLIGDVDFW